MVSDAWTIRTQMSSLLSTPNTWTPWAPQAVVRSWDSLAGVPPRRRWKVEKRKLCRTPIQLGKKPRRWSLCLLKKCKRMAMLRSNANRRRKRKTRRSAPGRAGAKRAIKMAKIGKRARKRNGIVRAARSEMEMLPRKRKMNREKKRKKRSQKS